ncbi:MAG TPA: ATP-binding protein [Nocardioidaceae bacterium]|nr:ATP-binding protein [Nocardioidaceae bacterium]
MERGYEELPDAVLVADEEATVTEVNAAAVSLLERPADVLVGLHTSDALALTDLEGRDWWSCMRPYSGLASRSSLVETSWFLPNGREVLVTARMVRSRPRGPVQRIVVCVRDGAARRRSDRLRSDLVATVAHELRSPLTGVKGFTSTLLSKWERLSDSQRRLMLQTVDADADRLTRLIAELLDVARIDSHRLTLRRQPVDVCSHVRGLLSTYPLADGRTLCLRTDTVPEVWVDPDKLTQVLTNLLDNAVRHGSGQITVSVAAGPQHVEVSVEDQGPGIPAAMRERVFAKYWRHGERTGTGLGLYIVQGLVTAHGGHVTVDAGECGGALFRATFPTGAPRGLEP